MKIAVSDYDGTLGSMDGVKPEVMEAIKEWCRAGHKFGIATGRDRTMMCRETDRCEIPLDFLICCNGAILYDGEKQLLAHTDIPQWVIPRVLEHPATRTSIHYVLTSFGHPHLYAAHWEDTWFPKVGVNFTPLSYEEARQAKDMQQINLFYRTAEECARQTEILDKDLGGDITLHPNGACLDITSPGVDKGAGVQTLLETSGWTGHQVLCIGDGDNDLPMLRRFGGFTVPGGSPAAMRVAQAVYPDVAAMLRAHL